jgi:hypothetical protein
MMHGRLTMSCFRTSCHSLHLNSCMRRPRP